MFTVAILGTTLLATAPAPKVEGKDSGIVGEWVVERQETGGGVLPFGRQYPLHFVFTADGKWAMYSEGSPVVPTAKYKLELKARPSAIDLLADPTEKFSFGPYEGVFQVHGDTLTLCHSVGRHPRPKGFDVSEDDSVSLFVMKRVK